MLPSLPPPSDIGYWIKSPSKEQFQGCCNEFWWCLNNVVKGILREQLPYAIRMYMETCHKELEKMSQWYIGIDNNFSVSTGMWGKYFKKYLPNELYNMYIKTYTDGDYNNFWRAIYIACNLFHILASYVSSNFGYIYRQDEEDGFMQYLDIVKEKL